MPCIPCSSLNCRTVFGDVLSTQNEKKEGTKIMCEKFVSYFGCFLWLNEEKIWRCKMNLASFHTQKKITFSLVHSKYSWAGIKMIYSMGCNWQYYLWPELFFIHRSLKKSCGLSSESCEHAISNVFYAYNVADSAKLEVSIGSCYKLRLSHTDRHNDMDRGRRSRL